LTASAPKKTAADLRRRVEEDVHGVSRKSKLGEGFHVTKWMISGIMWNHWMHHGLTHMQPMVLVYLPTKLADFVRANVGIHIPAPWSIWRWESHEANGAFWENHRSKVGGFSGRQAMFDNTRMYLECMRMRQDLMDVLHDLDIS
jgi:hypothetical protein